MAYLELGDEQLDMYQVQEKLAPYMNIETFEGGHHRLAYPSRLNDLIMKIYKNIWLKLMQIAYFSSANFLITSNP